MSPKSFFRASLLAALLGVLLVSGAAAELRRVEAVGAVGVREGDRRDPRALAVAKALREAVLRVASEYLVDAEWPVDAENLADENAQAAATEASDLAKVLGKDIGQYAARFKVIEDRGTGPVLFVEDANVTEEYVVVAEVMVDADRVRDQLVTAGLLEERVAAATGVVHLAVQGLTVYPAFVDVRELITGPVGAESAIPIEFGRGRATLAVVTPMTGRQLVSAIEREAPAHLMIIRLGSHGTEPRIAVRWTPPPEEIVLPPVESDRADRWKLGKAKR